MYRYLLSERQKAFHVLFSLPGIPKTTLIVCTLCKAIKQLYYVKTHVIKPMTKKV